MSMSRTDEAAMLSPDRLMDFSTAAIDYDVVRRAIAHIRGNWQRQPEVEEIAEAAGVSVTDLHHLFRRWAGLTPKAFLQALTLDSARRLLRERASVLDASQREHVPASVNVERVPLKRAAGKRLNPSSLLIQANVAHIRVCEHANILRLSQHV